MIQKVPCLLPTSHQAKHSMTPHRVLLCVAKAISKKPSTKPTSTESEIWKKAQREWQLLGGKAHHWLYVSCPDVELILPIRETRQLENMEKSHKLTLLLGRSLLNSQWQWNSPFCHGSSILLTYLDDKSTPETQYSYLNQTIQLYDGKHCTENLF